MASTSQILSWVEIEAHGVNRPGALGSLALLNEAHKILRTARREQNVIFDDSTGELPVITTVAGVFKYVCPDDVLEVAGVLINAQSSLGYNQTLTDCEWSSEQLWIAGRQYLRIKNLRTQPATRNTAASILFLVDPGDSDDTYLRWAYKKPTEILSPNIQHDMQEPHDTQYLMPATIMLIKAGADHSKAAEVRRYIEEVLKPAYWKELDGGEQGHSEFCIKRRF